MRWFNVQFPEDRQVFSLIFSPVFPRQLFRAGLSQALSSKCNRVNYSESESDNIEETDNTVKETFCSIWG